MSSDLLVPRPSPSDDLIDVGAASVHWWLLKVTRCAHPDPDVNVQTRFGARLGHDGTYINHVESGRRPMPTVLRKRWLELLELDETVLEDFLGEYGLEHRSPRSRVDDPDFRAFDDLINGASLSPREWAGACRAVVELGDRMPRTLNRVCSEAVRNLALASPPEYSAMVPDIALLPPEMLVETIRTFIAELPGRGYQVVDVLARLDGGYSGPLLHEYFREPPDPWLLRSVTEAMRQLARRDQLVTISDDPTAFQRHVLDRMQEAPSWTSRVELANFAMAVAPLPPDLHRLLTRDEDQDVRIAAAARSTTAALRAVRRVREEAIIRVLDSDLPSWSSDTVADTLAGLMLAGRSRRIRIFAARALGLSPYRHECARVLAELLSASSPEVRRSAAQAMAYFPLSDPVLERLRTTATGDAETTTRGRAIASLIPHGRRIGTTDMDRMLADPDPTNRRTAVDLAAAAGYAPGLRTALLDPDPQVARAAATAEPERSRDVSDPSGTR